MQSKSIQVEQVDREAAAGLYCEMNGLSDDHYYAATLASGSCDDHEFIRAFARHRLASTRNTEVVEVLKPFITRLEALEANSKKLGMKGLPSQTNVLTEWLVAARAALSKAGAA